MADLPVTTDRAQTEPLTQNEDLRLKPDAVVAVQNALKNTYASKGGELSNPNAMDALKIYLGNGYKEEVATETSINNAGDMTGTPFEKDDANKVELVRLTIEDSEMRGRIDKFKATVPLDTKDQKGNFFPPYRSTNNGYLFNMSGDIEGKQSGIYVARSKYENEKEPTKVTFYVEKGKFEAMAREATGLPKLETSKF